MLNVADRFPARTFSIFTSVIASDWFDSVFCFAPNGEKPFNCGLSAGAPRPMEMGTIASLWRYDAEAFLTLREPRWRRLTMPYYAWIHPRADARTA